MTEERMHAFLFAATLLFAWKLIGTMESEQPNLAMQYLVDARRLAACPRTAQDFAVRHQLAIANKKNSAAP